MLEFLLFFQKGAKECALGMHRCDKLSKKVVRFDANASQSDTSDISYPQKVRNDAIVAD